MVTDRRDANDVTEPDGVADVEPHIIGLREAGDAADVEAHGADRPRPNDGGEDIPDVEAHGITWKQGR